MKTADRFKLNNEIKVFFIVTFLFTWVLWLPALLIQNYGISMILPYSLFITIGTFVPSAAGFTLAYIFGGKLEMHLLFKSMLNIRIRTKWLLLIFLVLPGVSAVSCLIFTILGGTIPEIQFAPGFIPIAFIYIFIFMGPLGEEAGWRGFALKRMLHKFSPMKASVVLGMVWSTWHLPLFFVKGTTQNLLTEFGIIPAISGYFLYTVMFSLLITLLYIMTNGSVFGSMLLHTVGNLSLGVIPLIFLQNGAIIVLLVLSLTTAIFTFIYRKDMLRKS